MNSDCDHNIKSSSRYHPSEFCTKLNYAYTTRQCDEYFEYLEELRRIIFGYDYRMTTETSFANAHSIHYHTRHGKTLVYELNEATDYGIKLSQFPSRTETLITETYCAEEHVLPQPETSEIIPPKLCHQLPSVIEERMHNCLHSSSEAIKSHFTDKREVSKSADMPYHILHYYPNTQIIEKVHADYDFNHYETDFKDAESLTDGIDETIALNEDFEKVLEETDSVFEELNDDTIDEDCAISDEKVRRIVGIVNRHGEQTTSEADEEIQCKTPTEFAFDEADVYEIPNMDELLTFKTSTFQLPFLFSNRSIASPHTAAEEQNLDKCRSEEVEQLKSESLTPIPEEVQERNQYLVSHNPPEDHAGPETSGNSVLVSMLQDYVKMVMDASRELNQSAVEREEEAPEEPLSGSNSYNASSIQNLNAEESEIHDRDRKEMATLDRNIENPEIGKAGNENKSWNEHEKVENVATLEKYSEKDESVPLVTEVEIQEQENESCSSELDKVEFLPVAPRKSSVEKWESSTLRNELAAHPDVHLTKTVLIGEGTKEQNKIELKGTSIRDDDKATGTSPKKDLFLKERNPDDSDLQKETQQLQAPDSLAYDSEISEYQDGFSTLPSVEHDQMKQKEIRIVQENTDETFFRQLEQEIDAGAKTDKDEIEIPSIEANPRPDVLETLQDENKGNIFGSTLFSRNSSLEHLEIQVKNENITSAKEELPSNKLQTELIEENADQQTKERKEPAEQSLNVRQDPVFVYEKIDKNISEIGITDAKETDRKNNDNEVKDIFVDEQLESTTGSITPDDICIDSIGSAITPLSSYQQPNGSYDDIYSIPSEKVPFEFEATDAFEEKIEESEIISGTDTDDLECRMNLTGSESLLISCNHDGKQQSSCIEEENGNDMEKSVEVYLNDELKLKEELNELEKFQDVQLVACSNELAQIEELKFIDENIQGVVEVLMEDVVKILENSLCSYVHNTSPASVPISTTEEIWTTNDKEKDVNELMDFLLDTLSNFPVVIAETTETISDNGSRIASHSTVESIETTIEIDNDVMFISQELLDSVVENEKLYGLAGCENSEITETQISVSTSFPISEGILETESHMENEQPSSAEYIEDQPFLPTPSFGTTFFINQENIASDPIEETMKILLDAVCDSNNTSNFPQAPYDSQDFAIRFPRTPLSIIHESDQIKILVDNIIAGLVNGLETSADQELRERDVPMVSESSFTVNFENQVCLSTVENYSGRPYQEDDSIGISKLQTILESVSSNEELNGLNDDVEKVLEDLILAVTASDDGETISSITENLIQSVCFLESIEEDGTNSSFLTEKYVHGTDDENEVHETTEELIEILQKLIEGVIQWKVVENLGADVASSQVTDIAVSDILNISEATEILNDSGFDKTSTDSISFHSNKEISGKVELAPSSVAASHQEIEVCDQEEQKKTLQCLDQAPEKQNLIDDKSPIFEVNNGKDISKIVFSQENDTESGPKMSDSCIQQKKWFTKSVKNKTDVEERKIERLPEKYSESTTIEMVLDVIETHGFQAKCLDYNSNGIETERNTEDKVVKNLEEPVLDFVSDSSCADEVGYCGAPILSSCLLDDLKPAELNAEEPRSEGGHFHVEKFIEQLIDEEISNAMCEVASQILKNCLEEKIMSSSLKSSEFPEETESLEYESSSFCEKSSVFDTPEPTIKKQLEEFESNVDTVPVDHKQEVMEIGPATAKENVSTKQQLYLTAALPEVTDDFSIPINYSDGISELVKSASNYEHISAERALTVVPLISLSENSFSDEGLHSNLSSGALAHTKHESNDDESSAKDLFSNSSDIPDEYRILLNEILDDNEHDGSKIKHLNESETSKQSELENLTPTQDKTIVYTTSLLNVPHPCDSELVPESSNCSTCADVGDDVPTNSSLKLPVETSATETSLNSLEQLPTSSVLKEVSHFLATACVAALVFASPSESSDPLFNSDIIEEATKYFSNTLSNEEDND